MFLGIATDQSPSLEWLQRSGLGDSFLRILARVASQPAPFDTPSLLDQSYSACGILLTTQFQLLPMRRVATKLTANIDCPWVESSRLPTRVVSSRLLRPVGMAGSICSWTSHCEGLCVAR